MNDVLNHPAALFGLAIGILLLFFALIRHYIDSNRRDLARRGLRDSPKIEMAGLVGQQLTWVQPTVSRGDYELHAGNDLVAVLHFRNSWGFSSFATGESADGCWMIRLAGLWPRSLTIRPCNADNEVARFRYRKNGFEGIVEFVDGRKLLFLRTARRVREFQSESGETLVRFISTPGWARRSSTVEIQPIAATMAELPWLLMLGWYVMALAPSNVRISST